jgi:exodeoxyribonuclease V beta subunit
VNLLYRAVFVDEFQDTDPLQWRIIKSLFKDTTKAFYLVGDPKQSIYRFRKADIYTYLEAKEALGNEHCYLLETNYRSCPSLVGALNEVLSHPLFVLPKTKSHLLYHPLVSGRTDCIHLSDGKAALHCLAIQDRSKALETLLLPYTVREILSLRSQIPLSQIAILVRSRMEATFLAEQLQKQGIHAFANTSFPIGQTVTYKAVRELIEALIFIESPARYRLVQQGPFQGLSIPHRLLLEQGLVPFFRALAWDQISSIDRSDMEQITEYLLAWEYQEGFTLEGLVVALDRLQDLPLEEGGRRQGPSPEAAVQIMTIHASKGLEFDIVFALGLISRPPKEDPLEIEEGEAEKLRHFYVAVTRAKERLYLPFYSTPSSKLTTPSDLWIQAIEAKIPLTTYLRDLQEHPSISLEELHDAPELGSTIPVDKVTFEPRLRCPRIPPIELCSFTSIKSLFRSPHKNLPDHHGLPTGTETGRFIHALLNTLFSEPGALWQSPLTWEPLLRRWISKSHFVSFVDEILHLVAQSLTLPLTPKHPLTLSDLDPACLLSEVEFLYQAPPHYVQGFIDLVFQFENAYYLLDWKTNLLSNYTPETLSRVMQEESYTLQAQIYGKAFQKALPKEAHYGGAFYLFLRGPAIYRV